MAGIFSKIMDFILLEDSAPEPLEGPQFYHRKCVVSKNSILITQGTNGAIKVFEFFENLETGESGFKEHGGCQMCNKEHTYVHKDAPTDSQSSNTENGAPSRGNWFSTDEKDSECDVKEESEGWASEDSTHWEGSESETDSDSEPKKTSDFLEAQKAAYVESEDFKDLEGVGMAVLKIERAYEDYLAETKDSESSETDVEKIQNPDVIDDFRRFMNSVHEENERRIKEIGEIFKAKNSLRERTKVTPAPNESCDESKDTSKLSSKRQAEKKEDVDPKKEAPPLATPVAQTPAAQAKGANQKAMVVVKPWVERALKFGVAGLAEEFKTLAKYVPQEMTQEAFNANKDKNRYQDVPCQDKGRIVLKFPGLSSDYIHANYLGTAHNPKKFICAQGPLENTQHSFWAMALQEKVECIIMLCNCIEMMKIKCHQYWPLEKDQKLTFGEAPNTITVTNMGAKKMSPEEQCINVTTLKVDWAEGSKTIQHLQWENWPDRGVPQTNLTAINLLSATRGNQNPILVHCSAGIGRTGTIVAIAYVQDKMMAGEDCMAMNELLKELRSHRPWSIQNEFQYLYLHRVLLAYFLERHKEAYGELLEGENGAKYKKWVEDYATATGSNPQK